MAKNRTEIKSDVNTIFVPTLEIVNHRAFLNDQADNLLFGKDVKQTQTVNASVTNIDFAGKDIVILDAVTYGSTSVITTSGLDDGNVKYLLINKNAGQAILFNDIDMTEYKGRAVPLVSLLYTIYNKNNVTYVKLLTNTVGQYETVTELALINTWTNANTNNPTTFFIDEFGYYNLKGIIYYPSPLAAGFGASPETYPFTTLPIIMSTRMVFPISTNRLRKTPQSLPHFDFSITSHLILDTNGKVYVRRSGFAPNPGTGAYPDTTSDIIRDDYFHFNVRFKL